MTGWRKTRSQTRADENTFETELKNAITRTAPKGGRARSSSRSTTGRTKTSPICVSSSTSSQTTQSGDESDAQTLDVGTYKDTSTGSSSRASPLSTSDGSSSYEHDLLDDETESMMAKLDEQTELLARLGISIQDLEHAMFCGFKRLEELLLRTAPTAPRTETQTNGAACPNKASAATSTAGSSGCAQETPAHETCATSSGTSTTSTAARSTSWKTIVESQNAAMRLLLASGCVAPQAQASLIERMQSLERSTKDQPTGTQLTTASGGTATTDSDASSSTTSAKECSASKRFCASQTGGHTLSVDADDSQSRSQQSS